MSDIENLTHRFAGRRKFLKTVANYAGAASVLTVIPRSTEIFLSQEKNVQPLSFEDGKYQTFPRDVVTIGGIETPVLHYIDLGTLGPDVDTIFGIDFPGNIATGAKIVFTPSNDQILETRVVGIKRTDLETVQLQKALGGDRFDVYRMSEHGGDKALDAMALKHAENTARAHQKVVYIGDLGLFEKQWGAGEKQFLNAIIRAQRPSVPSIGIQEPDFVYQRTW